ncbi:MAG: RNA polymerase factor sigma-32 [Polyangiaceae bacterium]|nr:RNA polymerase factor sigma-32 [Polyangiaceae bacterium]
MKVEKEEAGDNRNGSSVTKKARKARSKKSPKKGKASAQEQTEQEQTEQEAQDDIEFLDDAAPEFSPEGTELSTKPSASLVTVKDSDFKKRDSLARLDPLQAYMHEVQRHALLTPEEEKSLALKYHEEDDVQAAAQLVTANLRLVVKLAYEYRRAYRNMMDLIQEGNMGLMQAVKKFDPYRGVKLSSYAAWWIRAYMLRFILANARLVKVGTTQAQRKLFFNLSKEKAKLAAMGIEPTNEEVAKRLDVTEKEVDEMDRRMSRNDASLDVPVSENDGRQIARVELMPGESENPESAAESAQLGTMIREYLDEFKEKLEGKDLQIFEERMVAEDPRTLQDLGNEFGVSRERVRQLEARITKKLRAYLAEHLGDAVEMS